MALDKVLINHLDSMDKLENEIEDDIDRIVKSLSVDEIIENPNQALQEFQEAVEELLNEKYYPEAVKEGFTLAEQIEKDGDIRIDPSKDPNKNEGVI